MQTGNPYRKISVLCGCLGSTLISSHDRQSGIGKEANELSTSETPSLASIVKDA
jgi:hypothetical protein